MTSPIPKQIDEYEVTQELGSGSTGSVYLVFDQAGRPFAMKILRHDNLLQHVQLTPRFQQEVRALRLLNHPNVIQIHDHRFRSGHAPYYTMDFMPRSLLDVMGQFNLSIWEKVDILRQLALALVAIHGAGIVHRDIKPGNVLLDWWNCPKIVDFGIAMLGGGLPEDPGEICGTPAYMAPELFAGEPCDARSDIFSLGMLAYEFLFGAYPYSQMGLGQLIRAKREQISVPDWLGAEVQNVISRMLARTPVHRYQSAFELLCDLNQIASLDSVA